ncbi:MAG TPA: sigma factor [Pirellulales bacterium]|jgi:DNA-directed RNA polymerase specialized sigma24 family protein|nr:sigma factor [Pirellulales bacterium]
MYLAKEAVAAVLIDYAAAANGSAAWQRARDELVRMAYEISHRSLPRLIAPGLPATIDADDLIQAGVLRVLAVGHRYDPMRKNANAFGWLTTVIRMEWLGMIRKESKLRDRFERYVNARASESGLDTWHDGPSQLEQDEDAEDAACLKKWLDGTHVEADEGATVALELEGVALAAA